MFLFGRPDLRRVRLKDICCVEDNLLRFGRTVLVLSLDPNMKITVAGILFTINNRIRKIPMFHIALFVICWLPVQAVGEDLRVRRLIPSTVNICLTWIFFIAWNKALEVRRGRRRTCCSTTIWQDDQQDGQKPSCPRWGHYIWTQASSACEKHTYHLQYMYTHIQMYMPPRKLQPEKSHISQIINNTWRNWSKNRLLYTPVYHE